MDKNELRYFLTEATGECCPKFFKEYGYHKQIDFLTWEGFGKLWEWAKKQEWWLEFIKEATYLDNTQAEIDADVLHMKKGIYDFIDPTTFAKAVADYLQKK